MNRARLTDIAIALAAGILVAESPFTPNETGPSLAIGAIVGFWLLWYRSTRASSLPQAARSAAAGVTGAFRALPLVGWLALFVWVAIFWPTASWMYDLWTGSFWHNNHSLIIACLMVLMIHGTLRREAAKATPYDTSAWGLVPVALGCTLAAVDASVHSHHIAAIGLVITMPGMVLLLLGWQRFHALRLPLVMAVFLIPLPSLIANHLYLRSMTAEGVLWVLQAVGVRASLFHAQIELPNQVFDVSEACSGFSTLVAAIALSLFLISLCPSPVRRIVMLLAIVPLTLAANTLRVVLLVFMSMAVGTEVLDTVLHEASGVATFVVVIGSLFVIADRPSIREAFN